MCSFISEVFYDGRLLPRPENAYQRLNCDTLLDGTGLRFSPVEHAGNQNESPEEVEKLVAMVEDLLQTRATWSDKEGMKHTLRAEDVLVVAPYNAQVAALMERLPPGTRVGTVDKFQGQEAPVVFYSMATSTPEDAPRGMEFLYSLNRLNVAVSRARCVAVLIASPGCSKWSAERHGKSSSRMRFADILNLPKAHEHCCCLVLSLRGKVQSVFLDSYLYGIGEEDPPVSESTE